MTVFFISDTHFGDHRVLNLYPRPVPSVAAMDEGMIERWNAVVGPDDEVWHLGDFARTATQAAALLPQLNGKKHLILGNNDPQPQPAGWASIASYAELPLDGVDLVADAESAKDLQAAEAQVAGLRIDEDLTPLLHQK